MVTNYHVIAGGVAAVVSFPDGMTHEVEGVVAFDPETALAIAILDVGRSHLPSLDVASRSPTVGDDIFAVGHPSGLSCTVSRGIVSAMRAATELERFGIRCRQPDTFFIQTDVAISPGSSGGPFVLRCGRVVGVSTFGLQTGQSLNFGVPSSEVKRLYDRRSDPTPLVELFGSHEADATTLSVLDHVARLCVAASATDGVIDQREYEVIVDFVSQLAGKGTIDAYDAQTAIDEASAWVQRDGWSAEVAFSVLTLKQCLSYETLMWIASAICQIIEADGHFDSAERVLWQLIKTVWFEES